MTKVVPPKTLPKPKVRPVPAPKPKLSSAVAAAVVSGNRFQDETVDGSEVWRENEWMIAPLAWAKKLSNYFYFDLNFVPKIIFTLIF